MEKLEPNTTTTATVAPPATPDAPLATSNGPATVTAAPPPRSASPPPSHSRPTSPPRAPRPAPPSSDPVENNLEVKTTHALEEVPTSGGPNGRMRQRVRMGDGDGVASLPELRPLEKADSLLPALGKVSDAKWERDADLEGSHGGHGDAGKVGMAATLALAVQAIGVVYGDIGTSPLYVFASTFTDAPSTTDVVGVVSCILWSLTMIVLLKYSIIVLYAQDHGNGGTFALYSILKRAGDFRTFGQADVTDRTLSNYDVVRGKSFSVHESATGSPDWRQRWITAPTLQSVIRVLVVLGVGAIMGDGVLTPSISVVSACEGIQVADPSFTRGAIVGLSLAILVGIFLFQQFGTETIGSAYSPIVFVWLFFNGVVGIINIAKWEPGIFRAISPSYAIQFFLNNGEEAWRMLGGIVLSVTGAEALYADLGHFSQPAIMLSTVSIVYPNLMLTYLGQAAYLTKHPEDFSTTFWSSLPHGTFWPMFICATLATIVASQALISAVFQIVYQAIGQDFFPSFTVIHTSKKVFGQVYIPLVNYFLMLLVLIIVVTFQSSAKLGQAYGLAVICDMLLTTHFVTLVMICVWRLNLALPISFYVVFLVIEGSFLSAAVLKIPDGAWFTLLMAAIYAAVMLLWFWGRQQKKRYFAKKITGKFEALEDLISPMTETLDECELVTERLVHVPTGNEVFRRPGIAVYFSQFVDMVPPVLIQHLTCFPLVHQVTVCLTNRTVPLPYVQPNERLLVNSLPIPGFYHAVARYGYKDVIHQGEEFVGELTGYMLRVLYQVLLYCLATSPDLRKEVLTRSLEETLDLKGNASFLAIDPQQIKSRSASNRHGSELGGSRSARSSEHHASQFSLRSFHDLQVLSTPAHDTDTVSEANELSFQNVHSLPNAGTLHQLHDNQFTLSSFGPSNHPARLYRPLTLNTERIVALDEIVGKLGGERFADPDLLAAVDKLPRAVRVSKEIGYIQSALAKKDVAYVFGNTHVRLREKSNWLRRAFLELPYEIMVKNVSAAPHRRYRVPEEMMCEIGIQYEV